MLQRQVQDLPNLHPWCSLLACDLCCCFPTVAPQGNRQAVSHTQEVRLEGSWCTFSFESIQNSVASEPWKEQMIKAGVVSLCVVFA